MPSICPICNAPFDHKADLRKHVDVFHPRLSEDQRIARAKDNPIAYIKEHGFGDILDLVRQGKCPICKRLVKTEEIIGQKEWKEFNISGLCGPCQRKAKSKEGL